MTLLRSGQGRSPARERLCHAAACGRAHAQIIGGGGTYDGRYQVTSMYYTRGVCCGTRAPMWREECEVHIVGHTGIFAWHARIVLREGRYIRKL